MENFLCGAENTSLTLRHSGVKGILLTVNEWDLLNNRIQVKRAYFPH